MANTQKNKSLPFAIIGIVLLAAIGLGYWLLNSSKTPSKPAANTKSNSNEASKTYMKASPGANPPNALGPASALIVLEEFADFQCPLCATTNPKIHEIRNAYGDRIRVIFREFPLTQIHQHAYDAAVAAEAAQMQGKFWDMQNLLFTNQQTWTTVADVRKEFEGYAQKLGLDMQKFSADMAGIAAKQRVDLDLKRGRELNINSTPSIFINGKLVPSTEMDVSKMRVIIDAELQKLSGTPATRSNQNANAANAQSSTNANTK